MFFHFGHKKQDDASTVTEERIQALNTEFHHNADQSISDIRKINEVLSETVIVRIHRATHVR